MTPQNPKNVIPSSSTTTHPLNTPSPSSSPVTIEQIISCCNDSTDNENNEAMSYTTTTTQHNIIPTLRLMMIGCEESTIYGPNQNIAVSISIYLNKLYQLLLHMFLLNIFVFFLFIF
jgi:hypothetical protein